MSTDVKHDLMQTPEELLHQLAQTPQRIMDAWSRGDGQAFADVFTEDGSMILPGIEVVGRDNIANFMQQAFEGPYRGTQVVGEPSRVTILSDSAAILHTVGGVRPVTATEVESDKQVRASWVMVHQDGAWRLAAYQNSPKEIAG